MRRSSAAGGTPARRAAGSPPPPARCGTDGTAQGARPSATRAQRTWIPSPPKSSTPRHRPCTSSSRPSRNCRASGLRAFGLSHRGEPVVSRREEPVAGHSSCGISGSLEAGAAASRGCRRGWTDMSSSPLGRIRAVRAFKRRLDRSPTAQAVLIFLPAWTPRPCSAGTRTALLRRDEDPGPWLVHGGSAPPSRSRSRSRNAARTVPTARATSCGASRVTASPWPRAAAPGRRTSTRMPAKPRSTGPRVTRGWPITPCAPPGTRGRCTHGLGAPYRDLSARW